MSIPPPANQPSGSTVGAFAVPRLALFYGGFFLVIGVLMPFWPLWLKSRGLAATEIGMVLAAGMWIKVLINPFTSGLADRLGERKRVIVVLSVMAFASFTLFAFVHGFWPVLMVSVLFFGFWAPMIPLGESLTMLTADRVALDYGRIRLWGSLSFIIAAGAAGKILAGRPVDLVYWLVLGAVGVAMGFCFLLPDIRAPRAPGRRLLILDVLRDKSFLILLAAAGMVQTSHAVYYAFGTLHWRAAGYTETVIGALWAEGVIAEIILFAFSGLVVRRFGPARLLMIAGVAAMVRWVVIGTTTALPALIAVQFLHAFTFGASHLAAVYFIARRVPKALSATAMALYSSIVMGIGMGGSLWAAGRLYADFGGRAYLAMAVLGFLGFCFAYLLRRQKTVD